MPNYQVGMARMPDVLKVLSEGGLVIFKSLDNQAWVYPASGDTNGWVYSMDKPTFDEFQRTVAPTLKRQERGSKDAGTHEITWKAQ